MRAADAGGLSSVLGFVSTDHQLTREWTGDRSVPALLAVDAFAQRLVVTSPLLQVSACLGALGSLVLAVEVIIDAGTRAAPLDDLVAPRSELR